ncbi:hypothetical protein J6590_096216 [Homalodisca vitripennis]|nr:hypothetical protein J6590_096216 [Homalodisca vitripennis]
MELKLSPRRACRDILRDPVRGTSCGCQEVYGSTVAPGMGRYAASGHSASCLSSTTARHHQCVCDLENPPATNPTIAASSPPSERGLSAPQHLRTGERYVHSILLCSF